MIHLCTCTGGSASAISSNKKRGGTVSCKNCGGRPAIDGKSSSSCLLSTVLELTSLINSDFTWTQVSKGCRSSSRRPRSSNSNTINLACGELLSKDPKGVEMPVSESEKLGVSVLGCHFSDKAEHIPIKKRRFLFRAPSPPCNTSNPSLEGAERHGTTPKSSSHGLQLYPNAIHPPATSEATTGMFDKVVERELVKDDDFSGISILAAAACSNSLGAEAYHCEKSHEVSKTVEFNVNNVKNEEPDSHASTAPSKDDEFASNGSSSHIPLGTACIKTNQEPNIHKSPVRDVRFSWDLNTTMDAWEEPFVSEHEISVSDAANNNTTFLDEKKKDYTKGNFRSPSKGISNQNLPVELKLLGRENKKLEVGKCEQLSSEFDGPQHAVVVKTEALHDKHTDGATEVIPVTRTLSLENTTHGIFSKWTNLWGQRSGGFGSTEAVDTKLSMDRCSVPPGFDHCLNLGVPKENCGASFTSIGGGSNVNFPITTTTAQTVMNKQDLSLTTGSPLENGAHQSGVTCNQVDDEAMTKMELVTTNVIAMTDLARKEETNSKVVVEDQHQPTANSSMRNPTSHTDVDNGFGYDNSQSDNRAGSGIDKHDEVSVGDDSQYEDGEVRESAMNAWKGYELAAAEENEYNMNNREEEEEKDEFNLGVVDPHETGSQNGQEGSSGIIKPTKTGSGKEADLTKSSVLLPEKLHISDEVEVSGSEPNEMLSGQERNERQDIVMHEQQHVTQSDVWKMNVSGWDILPENQRISSNDFSKTRNFTGRKFSYREEQKEGFDTDDVEMKADDSSRFYRKESLTRTGGPSTRDTLLSRGRFRMQGCSSSKAADGLSCRPERESGVRSFGRGGRYSPDSRRGVGLWNRSPERGRDLKHLPSPSYQGGQSFLRSMLEDSGTVDDMTIEGGEVDPSEPIAGRHNNSTTNNNASSYVTTRRPFRSRSPMDREANDFRARLGLRRTGDTSHDRFVNMGRGRGRGRYVRYGTTRFDDDGPRGRFHGPASDECDEFLNEYSHPFPRRRRCFSPIERRGGNNSYQHHHSDSRSPSRPRTRSPIAFRRRSRSPNFRPDTRIRRPRSPNYRDHPSEYTSGSRNNNPSLPNSRWVNYKERFVFDRRSPPPPGRNDGPQGERFNFYDSSRKTKQNEYYRSGHPGRFSDLSEGGRGRPRYVGNEGNDRADNNYRRGGFVRRYNMDGPARRFQNDDEDGFGRGFDARDRHALELHARTSTNPKPCNDGTDSRFRDFPRRNREDGGDFKRRSRDGKDLKEDSEHVGDDFERKPREAKDQSTTTTTTTNLVDSVMPNEMVKDGDDNDSKPMLGSN